MKKKLIILVLASVAISLLASFSLLSKHSVSQIIEDSIADTNTYNEYSKIINEKSIGKIWTDKSVSDKDMTIDNNLISKNSDEAFLSSLSALSVGLDLNIKEGNVKDIIIVQDVSGSMSSSVTGSSGTMTRIQASKNAINDLLKIIANVNDSLSPEDEKFHVSLITFSSSSAVKFNLTEVNNSNLAILQASVNSMAASGGTKITPGLNLSLTQLQSYGRSNVDSCIISFLDGTASDSAAAITQANILKNTYGVIMYSIILNNSATGGTTSAIDIIGQGLSSNYDYATSTTNLGTQTGNTYYFIPSTTDDLLDSFEKIIRSIQRKVYTLEKGSELTFKDTLGDYMNVKRVKAIVYDGTSYTNVTTSVSGNTTNYTFSGIVVDSLGNPANLNEIKITVTKSTDTESGDTITISIPYNLVPLSIYDVTSTFLIDSTAYTTKLDSAKPISIVYSSNIKDEVYSLYKNNDPVIENYVNTNGYIKDYNGYAYFYANLYSSGDNGTTEVKYTPYYFNNYYYYTDDTYLYTKNGENYTLFSGSVLSNETYYIKKTIYPIGDKISSNEYYETVSDTSIAQKDSKNNWYIESGNKKVINSTQTKDSNPVETAINVNSTSWNNSDIKTYLGNNGKILAYLEIDKIDLTVTKEWDDANNQDGIRPEAVTIELFANGNSLGENFIVQLNESNNWSYTYEGLPESREGNKISYTIEEINVKEGYAVSVNGSMETGYNITNSYNVAVLDITVNKIWDDANNQDGKRPESVTIMLKANGEYLGDNYNIVLNEDNNWTYTYQNLPKNKNGTPIEYSVDEEEVSQYETVITGSIEEGFTIQNIYNPKIIDINVKKYWNDNNNQNGSRPNSVKIYLLSNGEKSEENTIILNADNNFEYTFSKMPKYENGQPISYTIEEEEIANYKTKIEGDAETGFIITNTLIIENPKTGYKTIIISSILIIASFIYYLMHKQKKKLYKI